MFVAAGMLAYFIIAKYALKWPTHGEEDPASPRGQDVEGSPTADYQYEPY